jgi:hypothetical protein
MAQGSRFVICQRAVGEHPLPGYGPVGLVKRPVRTRMLGVVGAGGEKPPATRLAFRYFFFLGLCVFSLTLNSTIFFIKSLGNGSLIGNWTEPFAVLYFFNSSEK